MKGVFFDTWHSWNDFFLVLASVELGLPKPKINTVDVPAIDGEIDFSNVFGELKYKNRTLKLKFNTAILDTESAIQFYSEIAQKFHGKIIDIVMDDDAYWKYRGRIEIETLKTKDVIKSIVITGECDPYKVARITKKFNQTIVSGASFIYHVVGRSIPATITVDASMTCSINGGTSISLSVGSTTVQLEEGHNTIAYTGTGTINVEYLEKSL